VNSGNIVKSRIFVVRLIVKFRVTELILPLLFTGTRRWCNALRRRRDAGPERRRKMAGAERPKKARQGVGAVERPKGGAPVEECKRKSPDQWLDY